jgi:hypothetical protein
MISDNISKLLFLFIVFIVIAGGSITHVLSCQFQTLIHNSATVKHIFGIILIFLFIMLEGGWDFDRNENKKVLNDWTNGNTVHTMIYSIMIYMIFLVSSKSQLIPNMLFYSLLFILYFIHSYRHYLLNRNRLSKKFNNNLIILEKILLLISLVILLYGLIDYYIYKKHNLNEKFNLWQFFMYTKSCANDGSKDTKL